MLGPLTLGEALRLLRQRAQVPRDELARRAGVSAGAVSNYENDVSTPPASTLRRIVTCLADLLGVDRAELWAQVGEVLDATGGDRSSGRDRRNA